MNTTAATVTKLSAMASIAAIVLAAATAAAAFALGAGPAQPQRDIVKLERVVIEGKRMAQLPRVVVEGRRSDSTGTQLARASTCKTSVLC